MKKFICLLIALTCVLGLISCGDDPAQAFITIVNDSAPTKITTLTSINDGEETLTGKYETVIDGQNSVMTYRYDRYATVDEAADSYIKTVEGTVYYKNGLYSEDGENWASASPDVAASQVDFNLDSKLLGNYTISKDGKTLTTTVTSEQAKLILGVDVNASDDKVSITVVNNGKYLSTVTVAYQTATASVTIDTSYTYNTVAAE